MKVASSNQQNQRAVKPGASGAQSLVPNPFGARLSGVQLSGGRCLPGRKLPPLRRHPTGGFGVLQLLVVMVIVAVLLTVLLPLVQGMRETSRRTTCEYQLVGLGMALAAYHDRHSHYPAGTINDTGPILSKAEGYHHNWLGSLLPHLDSVVVTVPIDTDYSVYAPQNEAIQSLRLPSLICPSATGISRNTTCYAGIHHSDEAPIDEDHNGVFVLNRPARQQDIADGLSYTLFLGEKLTDPAFELGWISGTRSSLRNAGHAINSPEGMLSGTALRPLFVGGLQSHHRGGAHTLSGGGEVVFRADSTDQRLLSQLADKASVESAIGLEEPLGIPAGDAAAAEGDSENGSSAH